MKKHGYTLAETLITLGIIGIAATLLSPTFRQLIPSKEKMEFMECYKLLTNALPAIDFTPTGDQYVYVYDKYKKIGRVYPTCMGIACRSNDLGSAIETASSSSVYTWATGSATTQIFNSGNTEYYKDLEVVCTSKKSNNSFRFTLSGNGTITGLDDNGRKFMKDQFNYYKKGNEDEEE